ncbi:MAG: SGNH/GDSL hydrolase family protein [Lachnospiraceae bacterium]|nr:SGNH/GDSL hydrolase family protein [Lachnospiraceae bacterium]
MNLQKLLQKKNVKINIIGDSIAAGGGSTGSYKTEQLIFEDTKPFFRRVAPNSWWGLLETYLKKQNDTLTILNNGCGGAYSYQIRNHLDEMISEEDDIVFILMGLNDRKRKDGMNELKENSERILDELISYGKTAIVLTPNPSVHSNEYYENRLYHTDEVVEILKKVAKSRSVRLIDTYQHILNYLRDHNQKIDDIIFNSDGVGDGLHPGDFVQKLMFEKIIDELDI